MSLKKVLRILIFQNLDTDPNLKAQIFQTEVTVFSSVIAVKYAFLLLMFKTNLTGFFRGVDFFKVFFRIF